MKKKILVIGTGGTIACKQSESGLVPLISAEDLLVHVPDVARFAEVSSLQVCNLDSTDIRPGDWVTFAKAIRDNYENFDGFVLTHGTDTLAYTAAALSYLVQNSPKPIVVTGAQKPIDAEDTDARVNLRDSILYASSEGASGVVIVFDGKVIARTQEDYLVFDNRLPEIKKRKTLYLSSLSPIRSYVSYGELNNDCTAEGNQITIAGKVFEKGIAAHAPSELVYRIPKGAVRFTAAAGCDDEVLQDARYNIKYKVFVDGVQVGRTVLLPVGCYYVFDIALEPGSSELCLVCEPGVSIDHRNDYMHAEWAGAAFELDRPVTLWKIDEFFRNAWGWFKSFLEKIRGFLFRPFSP